MDTSKDHRSRDYSSRDHRIQDLGRTELALRGDLVFTPRNDGGESYYLVEDSFNSKFFRVGLPEYSFMSLLDGNTSVSEAVRLTAQALPDRALSESSAVCVCKWLVENQLAVTDASSQPDRLVQSSESDGHKWAWTRWNPLVQKVPLVRPDRFFTKALPWIGWLHSWPALILGSFVILLAMVQLAQEWDTFVTSSRKIFTPSRWLWLGLCWVMLKLLHETAHGVVCKKYGGTVREGGVILILLAPLAYVDVTSSWKFRSKWQRIHTAFAGMFVELLIASMATMTWSASPPGLVQDLCLNLVIMAGITSVLFNANPLMRFDGYYILSDLTGIPNLYSQGQLYLRYLGRRYLLGARASLPKWSFGRSALIRVYGFAAMIWRIAVCASLILAAATLFHGAGVVLALIATLLWFGVPVVRLARYLACGNSWDRPNRLRFCCTVSLVSLCIALILYMPWPAAYQAPAIVEYSLLDVIRARSAGFVQEVHVRSGEYVEAGQVLIVLTNPDLELELADLDLAIEQSRLRDRVHQQKGEMAAYQAELKDQETLQTRRQEKQAQVDELIVRAVSSGTVLGRNLELLHGDFLQEGAEIASICNIKRKEVRISIAQGDIDVVNEHVGTAVRVRMRGDTVLGSLVKLSPGASLHPPHPSLCATAGGPLGIQVRSPDGHAPLHGERKIELLEPRFTGTVRLNPQQSSRLTAGQRGLVTFTSQPLSLGNYLYRRFKRWMKKFVTVA